MEQWKEWPTNPKYQVSSYGRIKGINGKIMNLRQHPKTKYLTVNLRPKKGVQKTYSVHRLVAETFLDNFDEQLVVDHINGIKTDNKIENLRQIKHKLNIQIGVNNFNEIYNCVRQVIDKIGYDKTKQILLDILKEGS